MGEYTSNEGFFKGWNNSMDIKSLKPFGQVKLNEPLAKHTTFKIGGPADCLVIVEDTDKLVGLLKYLDGEGTSYMIIGGGSNMLASDEGFQGVVIKVHSSKFIVQGDTLIVDAGCIIVVMAQESIKAGLIGFEWGVGVPGTIGGAVRGNAGAMGGEIKDVVEKVEIYRDGEVVTLNHQQCHFGYRDSMFKHSRSVIIRAYLRLQKNTKNTKTLEPMKKALEYLQYRSKTQPQGWANTGCIFKNVDLEGKPGEAQRLRLLQHFDAKDEKVQEFLRKEKISAGWLVEQAGMRGVRVGQAQVSERHGNFIVNLGGARAQDVQSLIARIKDKVYDRFGIKLEEEIQII